jgi:hypothetical protein
MSEMQIVHCDFCGLDFNPDCAEQSCQGCPLARGCKKITCPRCGYAILPEAALTGWLRSMKTAWLRRNSLENQ